MTRGQRLLLSFLIAVPAGTALGVLIHRVGLMQDVPWWISMPAGWACSALLSSQLTSWVLRWRN